MSIQVAAGHLDEVLYNRIVIDVAAQLISTIIRKHYDKGHTGWQYHLDLFNGFYGDADHGLRRLKYAAHLILRHAHEKTLVITTETPRVEWFSKIARLIAGFVPEHLDPWPLNMASSHRYFKELQEIASPEHSTRPPAVSFQAALTTPPYTPSNTSHEPTDVTSSFTLFTMKK